MTAARDPLRGKVLVREDRCDCNPLKCPDGFKKTISCCEKFGHSNESNLCLYGLVWCGESDNIDALVRIVPIRVWSVLYALGRAMTFNDYDELPKSYRKTELEKVAYVSKREIRVVFIGQRKGMENSNRDTSLCVRKESEESSCCDQLREKNSDYCLNDSLSFLN